MIEPPKNVDSLRVSILLTRYEVCANHHLGLYSLIWQVPAIAITIGGGLAAIVFSSEMPLIIRILLLLIGATLMSGMTVAFERFRMFQFRRRKDLKDIEGELAALGARRLNWDGAEIARQIRSGDLLVGGIPFYRIDGFQLLRGMMYLLTTTLFFLTALAIAAAFGRGPLAGT